MLKNIMGCVMLCRILVNYYTLVGILFLMIVCETYKAFCVLLLESYFTTDGIKSLLRVFFFESNEWL